MQILKGIGIHARIRRNRIYSSQFRNLCTLKSVLYRLPVEVHVNVLEICEYGGNVYV